MKEHCLFSQDLHIFDAKDRRIGNVKDPIEEKNVTNKTYFEKNTVLLKNNIFDTGNKQISNVLDRISDMDVVNKIYVDKVIILSGIIDYYDNITFNKVKNYYFEDDLKLKFDMTMILTLSCESEKKKRSQLGVTFKSNFGTFDKHTHTDIKYCRIEKIEKVIVTIVQLF